jgi:hypothetical protein
MMAARLECDVGSGAFGGEAAFRCLFQGDDLSMVASVVDVGAFGKDSVIADKDAADVRIGRGESRGIGGEPERTLHEDFVLKGRRHYFEDSWFGLSPAGRS